MRYLPELPRVRLLRRTPTRFTSDGPLLPMRADGPWPFGPADVPLLERRGAALRIAHTAGSIVLLLWVQSELEPLLSQQTRLHPSATLDPEREAYVELAPGTPLEVLERTTAAVLIRVRTTDPKPDSRADLRLVGWVPPDAVGDAYEERKFGYDFGAMDLRIKPATALLDAPGGKRLYELVRVERTPHTFIEYYDARRLAHRSGWFLVEYTEFCPGRVRVIGWVRADRARQIEPAGGGGGCGPGRGGDRWDLDAPAAPVTAIAKGTLLRASAGGPVVGKVLSDTQLPTLEDGRRQVPSMWGPLSVVPDSGHTASTR
jgi:hypothetical protein